MKPEQGTVSVSIVLPVYNEGSLLTKALDALREVMEDTGYGFEIVAVDDGSSDASGRILQDASLRDERIVPISLSRNFGKEAALAAGMTYSRGECVVFIDADLQHPPRLIPEMLELWRSGYDVVNARKSRRGSESAGYRLLTRLFNRVMSQAVGSDFDGASDFKLIDRQVAEALKVCPERNRFFRGLVAWVGFRVTDVEFEVAERHGGATKWNRLMLIRYALSNLLAFSSLPLQAVAYTGFAVSGIGFVLLLQTLYNYLSGQAAVGFTTVIAVEILLGGMILVAIGTIAGYLAKMYQEQKGRPLFIVRTERSRNPPVTPIGPKPGADNRE